MVGIIFDTILHFDTSITFLSRSIDTFAFVNKANKHYGNQNLKFKFGKGELMII